MKATAYIKEQLLLKFSLKIAYSFPQFAAANMGKCVIAQNVPEKRGIPPER